MNVMKHLYSTYSVLTHTLNSWVGTKTISKCFQNMVLLHIKLKGMMHAATWQHQIFTHSPSPLNPGAGVKRSISTFSEYGHIAYHIIGNDACSKKVANFLPADPPPPTTLGMQSKSQSSSFKEHGHVTYQYKQMHLQS